VTLRENVRSLLQKIVRQYEARSFHIVTIFGDPAFRSLRTWVGQFDSCGADDHVPDIERYIRTWKERICCGYHNLPFKRVPCRILSSHMENSTLWLNTFPKRDSISRQYSPFYLMHGHNLTFDLHARCQFGQYVQTHEEHSNGMEPRTTGAICLGPTGNAHGSHYFFSLTMGNASNEHVGQSFPCHRM
jgi:hypothetical protein